MMHEHRRQARLERMARRRLRKVGGYPRLHGHRRSGINAVLAIGKREAGRRAKEPQKPQFDARKVAMELLADRMAERFDAAFCVEYGIEREPPDMDTWIEVEVAIDDLPEHLKAYLREKRA